ncbi:PREDICTED: uncharacterized protein LOC108362062 [Rhagoletis zephyria]|uniref:uncharacterized protein LOC108362062 n=1 Tax=Rhagoletis zephyria TaxID=28612 RepID=UPI0008119ABD|nr:PREDICTED: uncharacterized protein LOC108362062 [Rhagoletis zephyria]
MPRPRRNDIGRRSRRTQNRSNERQNQSQEEREIQNQNQRERMARSRSGHSPEERIQRNEHDRLRMQAHRAARNVNENAQRRQQAARINVNIDLNGAGFQYNNAIDYSLHKFVVIGAMDKICQYCNAVKFKTEPPGMCCTSGKVRLPELQYPPEPLASLLSGSTPQSNHFLDHIQMYNSCFQMTSFGATNIIRDNFMPTFKIQGQIYHKIGSLLPFPDANYQFLQIYFLGNNQNEVDTRCAFFKSARRLIIEELQAIFHEHNELVTTFKTALDQMQSDDHKIVIRADRRPIGEHERRFNAPLNNEIAIVIVGEEFQSRDIVLRRRNNQLQRVCETHRCYDALQYPILFCRGEDGYSVNIKMVDPANPQREVNKNVSAMNYYAYRIMIRQNQENHILKARKLFHQYIVDMYAKIETERLNFIRFNQRKLRSEEYIHLRDAINNDRNVNNIGQMVILPSTYTGSPRHMHEYAQDAICYVRCYGRPDLFITFTCNPKWEEIKKYLYPGQSSTDRHDITARIFRQKLKSLMDFIVKYKVYGEVRCWMYSVEWQKRGLPHAHILIWLVDKITTDQIDDVISAEIPDQTIDPDLFDVVTKNMIHGPCGVINVNSPCMQDGKCTKRYPRALISETITGNDGYPLYRRRSTQDNGKSITLQVNRQDFEIDNRWVVPYSPLLSKAYKAHINVEYCNSVKSIKYICKYINKGSDMAVFGVAENRNDEITQYQMGRYISSNEAVWRILSFPIHDRSPAVIHLAVHLENGQRVYFTVDNAQAIVERPPSTTLISFFKLCERDQFAKTLLYAQVPTYYTWNVSSKTWERRKRGKPVDGYPGVFESDAIGRLYTVHPSQAECFYLRLLLINVRGPTSFLNLKRVNGRLCQTYRRACEELHLLEDDNHWDATLADASATGTPHQIRTLFSIIVATCFPSDPLQLWQSYRDYMTEDILNRMRRISANQELLITLEMYNEALIIIEDMCLAVANKLLSQLGLPPPNRAMHDVFNQDIQREQQYDINDLNTFINLNLPKLNIEQKHAYDTIMQAIQNKSGGMFFLDAPGGTGKTFLISLLLATVRSQNNIALALASSGIAATLLDGGRTAHSALKLPLNMQINENPTCNISKNSGMGRVLQQCKLIVWDECTMAHKKSVEALDRTLKDLRNNQEIFGGALILLSGDFRQTLPVIPRSTPADELKACLKTSHLWRHVKTLTLKTNLRVYLQNYASADEFSRQLLKIGNGQIPIDAATGLITLPDNFCNFAHTKQELVSSVFPNIAQNYQNHNWLAERAILAAKNKDVGQLNANILNDVPGEIVTFKSIDTVINQDDAVNYPTEFLNSLDFLDCRLIAYN